MNWKDYPHLFVNGYFGVKTTEETVVSGISGYDHFDKEFIIQSRRGGFAYRSIQDCTLIARKIEDMTDEEVFKLIPAELSSNEHLVHVFKKVLTESANEGKMLGWMERELANIGIYFGPQGHFKTGEVLNVKEVQA